MLKKYALTALASGAMIVALAPTANAHDTRTHTCQQEATRLSGTGVFTAGTRPQDDRCVVTVLGTPGDPVPSATITHGDVETRVVDEYASEPELQVSADPISVSDPVITYGEWLMVDAPVTETITTKTGKGKSTNTKTVVVTEAKYERTVTSTVTYTYDVVAVTYTLQDIESYRVGEQATTITTPTTVRTYTYRNNSTSSTSFGNNTGTPVAGDPVVTDGDPIPADDQIEGVEEGVVLTDETTGEPVVHSEESVTPTEENGGIVVEETPQTSETETVVTKETCVTNKNKSKNRVDC